LRTRQLLYTLEYVEGSSSEPVAPARGGFRSGINLDPPICVDHPEQTLYSHLRGASVAGGAVILFGRDPLS